jgi:GAF domain
MGQATHRGGVRTRSPAHRRRAGAESAVDRKARRSALAETDAAFRAGGPYLQAVLQALANRLAEALRSACLIRPGPDAVHSTPLVIAHADAAALRVLRLLSTNAGAFASACDARAAQTGQSIFLPLVSSACMRLWSTREAWWYLEHVEVSSVIVAPVRAGGRVFGMLLLWREGRAPRFTRADRVFAEEVATRLAPAFVAAEKDGSSAILRCAEVAPAQARR